MENKNVCHAAREYTDFYQKPNLIQREAHVNGKDEDCCCCKRDF